MAISSLFTLLDDIASVLDDVALMTKAAAKKTAGVIGDDLALNAGQVSGDDIRAERELPIVWAVAKGSLVNKAILIPLALLLSAYLPALIVPLLMLGGAYLCFEGVEKLWHKWFAHDHHEEHAPKTQDEATKIRGAVRTDFILSAEIIIIALGVLQESPLMTQILALCAIGVGITILVYGLVAFIVKLDDMGLWLQRKPQAWARAFGAFLIALMPWLMKSLAVIGTLAMFFVGGGIFVHNLPILHHALEALTPQAWIAPLWEFVTGVVVGALLCAVILPLLALFSKKKAA